MMDRWTTIAAALLTGAMMLPGCGSPPTDAGSPFENEPLMFGTKRRKRRQAASQYLTVEEIVGPEAQDAPLRFKGRRVRSQKHKQLVKVLNELRSNDIGKYHHAEGQLEELGHDLPVADYMVQLLGYRKSHVRSAAVRLIAKFGSKRHYPALIDRLEDRDERVRWNAMTALRRMSGESQGYRHRAPRAERDAAVARWREWYAEERRKDRRRR